MSYATYNQKKALYFIYNNNEKYINGKWTSNIPKDVMDKLKTGFYPNVYARALSTSKMLYNANFDKAWAFVIINQYLETANRNKRDARIMQESIYHCNLNDANEPWN